MPTAAALEKGPCIVLDPGEGDRYWQPAPSFGDVTLRITPLSHPGITFAAGEQRLSPGGAIPRHAHEVSTELLYVLRGTGVAMLDGESFGIGPGDTILAGHHVEHEIINTGDTDLVLYFHISPPGLEDLLSGIGRLAVEGEEAPSDLAYPDTMPHLMTRAGFVGTGAPPKANAPVTKGPACFIAADEGDSYWQPIPANGYATVKFSPLTLPLNDFAMGVQILEPGATLPEHAHSRNDELKLIVSGWGTGRVDGVDCKVGPGTLAFTGRYVTHTYTNLSDEEMVIVWLIRPPGLELMLAGIGEPRTPGVPRDVEDLQYREDALDVVKAAHLVVEGPPV
jgi:uncharacterized cupin superfamily protein